MLNKVNITKNWCYDICQNWLLFPITKEFWQCFHSLILVGNHSTNIQNKSVGTLSFLATIDWFLHCLLRQAFPERIFPSASARVTYKTFGWIKLSKLNYDDYSILQFDHNHNLSKLFYKSLLVAKTMLWDILISIK